MPKFDGTGPSGQGSQTGRGLGKCNNGKTTSWFRGCFGGFGRKRGNGMRRGFNFRNNSNKEDID